MQHVIVILFFTISSLLNMNREINWHTYKLQGRTQGTTYSITYYAADSVITANSIDSILSVIDSSMSLYKSYSLINQFNQSENGLVIDEHFQAVIKKSIEVFKASNGLFDITVKPLVEAWGFYGKRQSIIPDSTAIHASLKCTGLSNIRLTNNFLAKIKPCIQLDVNGIAQGYSVDVLADFLETKNVFNYLVEIGGEIRIKGVKRPSGLPMTLGIESPGSNEFTKEVFRKLIVVKEGAITTSGNYRKYFESDGKTYAHLINPKTGYPVQNELISVTVYASDAITADAYDNVLMVLGLKKGLAFINSNQHIAAFLIYKKPGGGIADTMSINFKELIKSE